MKLNKLMIALVAMFTCFIGKAMAQEVVAEVGGVEYTDIYAAFTDAKNNDMTVEIRKNLELNKKIILSNYANVAVEGDGYTLRFTNSTNGGFVVKSNANVTFGAGLNIVGAPGVCPLTIQTATVTTSANISAEGTSDAAIMSVSESSAQLTINGGTVVANGADAAGIYWPSSGSLVINDGNIEGATALYFKSGNLEINGGEFVGNGTLRAYEHVEDGYIPTGAAVMIENVGDDDEIYPTVRAVHFNGGAFSSANSVAVQSETAGFPEVPAKTGFIKGGQYSSDVTALVAVGYALEENGGVYTPIRDNSVEFEAKIGEDSYKTFAEALQNVRAGQTITLLKDITLSEKVLVGKNNITFDLDGKTVTVSAQKAFEVHGTNAAFINGKIFAEQRCVDTRNNVTVTLSNLELAATSTKYGNPQPITVGGSSHGTVLNLNNVNVDFPVGSGYAVIAFVRTDLTATNCTFDNAFSALYFKEPTAGIPTGSAGSNITLNNCYFYAQSGVTGDSNYMSLIALRAADITVTINGGLLKGVGQVSAFNFHGYDTYTGGTAYARGCTLTVTEGTEIEGDLIRTDKENFADNEIYLPATEDYKAMLTDQNFLIIDNPNGTVSPTKNLDLVDGEFAYTNKADLEGMEITYKRRFANAGVWNAVFLPFDVPLSEDFLNKYKVAEWTNVNYTLNGSVLEGMSLELTLIKDPTAVLQANKPYFICVKDAKDLEFNVSLTNATLYGALDDDDNKVNFTFDGVMTCTMSGNYETLYESEIANDDTWVVSASGTWVHAKKMKPFRVKLVRTFADGITISPVAATMRVFIRDLDEGTTAIEGVENESEQTTTVYDLQGRRVMDTAKSGIYIVNGKKVVVK